MYAVAKETIVPIRANPTEESEQVNQLLFGEPVKVYEESNEWARISSIIDGYQGWVTRKMISETKPQVDQQKYIVHSFFSNAYRDGKPNFILSRGSYLSESFIEKGEYLIGIVDDIKIEILRRDTKRLIEEGDFSINSVIHTAMEYVNVPYLWGGKSSFGIDCSALVQQIFNLYNVNLDRDTGQQIKHGEFKSWKNRVPGDVVFFINEMNKVHHVGLLIDHDHIIHASGCVKIDQLTEEGIYDQIKLTHKNPHIRSFQNLFQKKHTSIAHDE